MKIKEMENDQFMSFLINLPHNCTPTFNYISCLSLFMFTHHYSLKGNSFHAMCCMGYMAESRFLIQQALHELCGQYHICHLYFTGLPGSILE